MSLCCDFEVFQSLLLENVSAFDVIYQYRLVYTAIRGCSAYTGNATGTQKAAQWESKGVEAEPFERDFNVGPGVAAHREHGVRVLRATN
jgi:hypothetical protein